MKLLLILHVFFLSRFASCFAQSLLTGLLFHQPDNHISYLEECLASYKQSSESLQWNTFMAMPTAQNSKVFGLDNKLPSNNTPLPPIGDSQVSMNAESTEKSTSVPVKLDNKSVLPPISCSDTTGDQKPETTSASSLHATEPLPPIANGDKVTKSNSTEQAKLKKEDMSPLPPIEAKEAKASDMNTTESIRAEEKSPLPPIAEKNETNSGDDADAASSNIKEPIEIENLETSPLPPIGPDNDGVQFGNVYFVLG